MTGTYDPFVRGPFPVGVRTVQAVDVARQERSLPFEVWYPAATQYAGQDSAEATQDTFVMLPGDVRAVYQDPGHEADGHLAPC